MTLAREIHCVGTALYGVKNMEDVTWLEGFLKHMVPRADPLVIREPLETDEAHWFREGIEKGLFVFCTCDVGCKRLQRRKERGPDEFRAAFGQSEARHLFSLSIPARLNREYIPHMAAVARLVRGEGYDQTQSSFSRYREFTRDLCWKKKGQSYESDVEFYDSGSSMPGGAGLEKGAHRRVWIQVEAKKHQREISRIVEVIESTTDGSLVGDRVPKELEYVLDLKPKYLWLVAPGLIDPASYVYGVEVGGLEATFSRQTSIPRPP